MASITDHVIKLQELTQKNLDILQTLNDSFFTNQNHLSVRVGDNQYAIPSFISLENKINSLTANFENLVNAPETGEAFFDFNGNSRAINVRSYTSTPNSLVLDPVNDFSVEQNDIFKDFLTPCPYIHLNVQSLPNDTTQVLVKKVIPTNSELKMMFKASLEDIMDDQTIYKTSTQYPYKDLYKILDQYKQDVDYIEYDTRVDLPIRKNVGSGTYVIEEIVEDIVDENLDNYITLKLRTDVNDPTIMSALKYRLFDETIEKSLKIGDQLVTFEGNAKMEITDIHPNTNTIIVKVLHGEFLNLVPSTTNNLLYISPLSKVKFYSPIDFDEDKYVRVPLEEDQYIFVAVAALNSRMNVQSPWGGGLMLNTFSLKNGDKDFKTYYEENVRNVGDVLFEITSMMSNTLTKYTKDEYDEFTQYIPEINVDNLIVTQINKHLNDSVAVKNIRSLYSQKIELQTQLTEVQNQLNARNEELSTISFDDTTGQRSTITSTIQQLNIKKNELYTAITKIMDEISTSANDSEVPIENAKYRIRGFFDISNIKWNDHIKGIRVQYRYKNANLSQNQALTINEKFVFSDWNEMNSSDRERIPVYIDGSYKSTISAQTDKVNEPSFNQIDIPISQGETVDIRLKVIYDYGSPFVQTSSKWSPIANIAFPAEYLKDIKILDIIEENNNDIEANRFNNIIKEEGIPTHISDKVTDQDITYFHKSENIASGFYTAERRIIPLKDKLAELNNLVIQLQDEILGHQNDQLTVSIKHSNNYIKLEEYCNNYIYTDAYLDIKNNPDKYPAYIYDKDTGVVTTVYELSLRNDTNHIMKLFPLFPGSAESNIDSSINNGSYIYKNKFDPHDYCINIGTSTSFYGAGFHFQYPSLNIQNDSSIESTLQKYNQYITFRKNAITPISNITNNLDDSNIYTPRPSNQWHPDISYESIYDPRNTYQQSAVLSTYENQWKEKDEDKENPISKISLMYTYVKLKNRYGLNINTQDVINYLGYLLLNPNDEIVINIIVEFRLDEQPSHVLDNLKYRPAKENETPEYIVYYTGDINKQENGNYYRGIATKDLVTKINRTFSFDVWTSLYKEPKNYTFTIIAQNESSPEDKIINNMQKDMMTSNTKYNVIYK